MLYVLFVCAIASLIAHVFITDKVAKSAIFGMSAAIFLIMVMITARHIS